MFGDLTLHFFVPCSNAPFHRPAFDRHPVSLVLVAETQIPPPLARRQPTVEVWAEHICVCAGLCPRPVGKQTRERRRDVQTSHDAKNNNNITIKKKQKRPLPYGWVAGVSLAPALGQVG